MNPIHTKKIFIFLFCILNFTSSLFAANPKLVDYVHLGVFPKEKSQMVLAHFPALNTLSANYSLNLYAIHYNTTAPDGKLTIASGLVAMPLSQNKPSILLYMHGTTATRHDVPSKLTEKNFIYLAAFSSHTGYMLVMPDYLGLGDNALPLHPYVQADTLANSSIDMLIASKELAAAFNYPTNDKLFLTGYSEGGYTTLVTYEELLKNHKDISVTAVAPGSAPYDWNETMHFITEQPGPRATIYLAYFFYSLQTYHHYWSGVNEIFRAPYNTLIPVLFDGTHELPDFLDQLPLNPRLIFNDAFYDSLLNGTNPAYEQMKKNFNHYDFVATAPMLMLGTKGDQDLPYHGAEIAYDVFKKKSDVVYIKAVSDVFDHLQAFPFVMKEQIEFFKRYE